MQCFVYIEAKSFELSKLESYGSCNLSINKRGRGKPRVVVVDSGQAGKIYGFLRKAMGVSREETYHEMLCLPKSTIFLTRCLNDWG